MILSQTKLVSLNNDIMSGKITATLELPENTDLNRLKNLLTENLDVRLEKHKDARSKNANAYFHYLAGKLAEGLNPPISKAHAKNLLITRYGQPMVDEDTGEIIQWKTELEPEVVCELETCHAIPAGYEGDSTIYILYRGSHEYNSKEMATLIDGTLSELEEAEIPVEKKF